MALTSGRSKVCFSQVGERERKREGGKSRRGQKDEDEMK